MTTAQRGAPPPFLFIVGCGRSGTTLLVSLVDSHPDLAIPGESGTFIFLVHDALGDAHIDPRAFVAELARYPRFAAWKLDEGDLTVNLERAGATSLPEAFRVLYATYAAAQGKARYGDKTPNHVLRIGDLAALFPEGRFVHVIRDGRDVALAVRDMSWGPRDMEALGPYWVERVAAGRREGRRLGPRRYLEVRYEDLVSDPGRVASDVCVFVDLTFDPVMLDNRASVERQIAMSPDSSEDQSLLHPIGFASRDWQAQMTRDERAAFESAAGDLLEELGYPV